VERAMRIVKPLLADKSTSVEAETLDLLFRIEAINCPNCAQIYLIHGGLPYHCHSCGRLHDLVFEQAIRNAAHTLVIKGAASIAIYQLETA
jgi:hypothetical protein